MVLCAGYMGRLGAVGFRAARPVFVPSQLRSLSTVGLQTTAPPTPASAANAHPSLNHCQRSRFILQHGELRSLDSSNPRSFWSWSKPAVNATVPVTPDKPAAAPPAPEVETAPSPEPPFSAEASLALDAASSVPVSEAVLPAIPPEVLPVDLASSIPSVLNYGDLAALGLASWTPAGISRWTMELINVSTGMPWFWTIVTTTVLSRVLLFPFTVKQMQSTAALAPYTAEVASIRDEMAAAQQRKDMLAMQRAALRQKVIYEKAGVSLGGMALAPFIQLPVTLGMFFGIKKLCDFPLEQLKWSGLEWLPDLTVADPTMVLPVAATILMNVQLSVTMRDLVGGAPQTGHVMNLFRILTTASVFIMWSLPTGVLVYLLTSICAMTAQSLLLRQPAVRRFLRIPVIPSHLRTPAPSMRESFEYAKKWWGDKVADTRVANRR